MITLSLGKVVFSVERTGELPEENVVVLHDHAVYGPAGELRGIAKDLVTAMFSSPEASRKFADALLDPEQSLPGWFEMGLEPVKDRDGAPLFLERLEPKVPRRVARIRVTGTCQRDSELLSEQGQPEGVRVARSVEEESAPAACESRIKGGQTSLEHEPLRFAVGERRGLRSGAYRIWTGHRQSDLYVAGRRSGNQLKAAIHFERADSPGQLRYVGLTRSFAESERGGAPVSLAERSFAQWPGFKFAPEFTIEYRVRFLLEDLREFTADDDVELTWVAPPSREMAREVALISGPPMALGQFPKCESAETDLLWEVVLPNGLRAWAVSYLVPRPTQASLDSVINKIRASSPQLDPKHRTPGLRLTIGFLLEDGSAGWVDMAGDRLL